MGEEITSMALRDSGPLTNTGYSNIGVSTRLIFALYLKEVEVVT